MFPSEGKNILYGSRMLIIRMIIQILQEQQTVLGFIFHIAFLFYFHIFRNNSLQYFFIAIPFG